jgi:hypothetical protein
MRKDLIKELEIGEVIELAGWRETDRVTVLTIDQGTPRIRVRSELLHPGDIYWLGVRIGHAELERMYQDYSGALRFETQESAGWRIHRKHSKPAPMPRQMSTMV